MADLLHHLQSRRSIPAVNLGDPAPDRADVLAMLTIAARVPDHGKLAPWRFILYEGDRRARIGDYLDALWRAREPDADPQRLEQERTRFTRAPLVVGVVSTAAIHPKIPVWEQQLSAGAVCMNLLHAVHAHGFAGQWITEWFAFDDEAAAYLGRRAGEQFAGFIHIGTPTEPPFERPRPVVAELITEWRPG